MEAAQRSKLLKSIARQEESALADFETKWGKEVRTAATDYFHMQEEAKERTRQRQLAMPMHLRTGTSATDMGCPMEYVTQTTKAAQLPVKMAIDPKWSTELKKLNDKVGSRIEYERRLSASITGQISPELPFMYPKRHISNPPSPFMEPGNLPRQRC